MMSDCIKPQIKVSGPLHSIQVESQLRLQLASLLKCYSVLNVCPKIGTEWFLVQVRPNVLLFGKSQHVGVVILHCHCNC